VWQISAQPREPGNRISVSPINSDERDRTIPISHGVEASEAIPSCRFETLPGAAHFPNIEDPEALADVLEDFLTTTSPVRIDDSMWGAVLARRGRNRLRNVA
jgi:hypothetical protein